MENQRLISRASRCPVRHLLATVQENPKLETLQAERTPKPFLTPPLPETLQDTYAGDLDIEKVTDAFYQGDSSKSQEGAGIGLYFVKKCTSILAMRLNIKATNNFFEVMISW